MRIGLIGGTGSEGRGLALRWARAGHDVFVGSRGEERGIDAAKELSELAGVALQGGSNVDAVAHAEIVLLSVPYKAHRPTLESLREGLSGKTLIDITVPLAPPKVRVVHLPEGNAAALEAAAILGEDVTVVAAMHHVSAHHLADLNHKIDCDVLVCSDSRDARRVVIGLIEDLGMRGIDAGRLPNAVALEALTPVLIHINKTYKSPGAGLRITGL